VNRRLSLSPLLAMAAIASLSSMGGGPARSPFDVNDFGPPLPEVPPSSGYVGEKKPRKASKERKAKRNRAKKARRTGRGAK